MNIFAKPGLGQTELPPVNSDDNGKVLGVADGVWAKVAASGGSDLPDDPAQDGTYNLQNTVSSGTSTLSWASGSSGGVLVVTEDAMTGVLDKTWQEIYDADYAVILVVGEDGKFFHPITTVTHDNGYAVQSYRFEFGNLTVDSYSTDSASGYPSLAVDQIQPI